MNRESVNKLNAVVKGEGEPILLMHGLFGASDNLGRLANFLSQTYQIHNIDLPNHGQSYHTDHMDYDLMASAVYQYINQQGLGSVKLFGHSMGGKVAMALALKFGEIIEKVVVGDIAPVEYSAHHKSIFAGLDAIDLSLIDSRNQADEIMRAHIQENSVRQFLLKNLKRSKDGVYEWKMNLAAIKKSYKNILSGLSSDKPFTKPVLFIAGGQSDYITAEYRAQTLSLFPQAQVKVIPDTGHWLHAEKPDLFNSLCLKFFKD